MNKVVTMKKVFTILKVTGLWIWFILMPLLIWLYHCIFPWAEMTGSVLFVMALITGALNFIIVKKNFIKFWNGKSAEDFSMLEAFSNNPDEYSTSSNKKKYSYPKINQKILYDSPQGFCFGRDPHTKKYICRRMDEEGAILISGGSGTGKSANYVINYLLWCKGYDLM